MNHLLFSSEQLNSRTQETETVLKVSRWAGTGEQIKATLMKDPFNMSAEKVDAIRGELIREGFMTIDLKPKLNKDGKVSSLL